MLHAAGTPWPARLKGAETDPLLAPAAPADAGPQPPGEAVLVGSGAARTLHAMTGGAPEGLLLLAVAAVRLVVAGLGGAHRVPVVCPAFGEQAAEGAEFALLAPLDPDAPATAFVEALYRELAGASADPWPDRAALAARLAASGAADPAVLDQLSVVCPALHGDRRPAAPTGAVLTVVQETPDEIRLTAQGSAELAAVLPRCVAAVLEGLAADPRRPAGALDVLGAAQRAELEELAELPVPGAFAPDTLTALVAEQCRRIPDSVAVTGEGRSLTYRQLAAEVERVAGALAQRYGIGPGDRVGVLADRGAGLVVSFLAVLRAGAAFVPLDPGHPTARLTLLTELSGSRLVLRATDAGQDEGPDAATAAVDGVLPAPVVDLDALRAVPAGPSCPAVPGPGDDAIVFFTSGSTGTPRPVALRHDQLAHKVLTGARAIGIDAATRTALLSAITSDATTFQIFATLLSGGTLVAVGAPDRIEPAALWQRVREGEVTLVNCVPGLLSALLRGLSEDAELPLRHLLLGGDTIPRGLLRRTAGRLRVGTFANLYGPSEATIDATMYIRPGGIAQLLDRVPVGRPSPGYGVLVVTPTGELAPVGVSGEILVAGAGVAEGYLGDEEATAARFTTSPHTGDAPVFRTGDLGRWRPDGELEFLGRGDGQVQIFGNRVETGEIEQTLVRRDGVTEAVVVPRVKDGQTTLHAWYTGPDSPEELVAALRAELPSHMRPASLRRLDALPLTAHGKVDKRALLGRLDSADGPRWRPADPLDALVSDAWAEVFGQPPRTGEDDFFAVDGLSLAAVQLVGTVCEATDRPDALTIHDVLDLRTPAALAAVLRERGARPGAAATAPAAVPRTGPLPATNAQRRMWLLDRLDDSPLPPYNMVEAYRIENPGEPGAQVDTGLLAARVDELVARHEALRTVLRDGPDGLEQIVLPAPAGVLAVEPVPDGTDPRQVLEDAYARECAWRFDLAQGPLTRVTWLPDQDGGTLLFNIHHAMCDGWSYAVLLRDLVDSLRADASAPAPAPQYAEHTHALADRLAGPQGEAHRTYWTGQLAELPDPLQLPTDRRRPAVRGSAGGKVRLPLPAHLTDALSATCREAAATPFMGIVAAVRVLLLRLCGQSDALLGTVVAGRSGRRAAETVGLFANTVVLRTPVDPEHSFRDLLGAVRATGQEAMAHAEYPFEQLVEDLRLPREANRNPVFDVLVETALSGTTVAAGAATPGLRHVELDPPVSDFDLAFSFLEATADRPGELWVAYTDDLFDRTTAQRIGERLLTLLTGLLADPGAPVRRAPVLPEDERRYLLDDVNDTAAPFPDGSTLLDLVAEQTARTPDRTAVVHGATRLTFAELDARAETLAARLLAAADPAPGRLVAVVMERTEWMVAAVLAVLRTGAAFLPLDPEQPADRLALALADSGAVAVLADGTHLARATAAAAGVPVLDPRDPAPSPVPAPPAARRAGPRDLAYVIYTSGSTGRPKGVMVEHRGIVNTVHYRAGYYGFDEDAAVLQVPPLHSDSGVNDIFSALIAGTRVVVLAKERLLDVEHVAEEIRRNAVTHIMMVPSLYQLLLERCAPQLTSVRQIVLVGERLSEELAAHHARLLPHTVLYNEYGPTEDSVWTTVHRITDPGADVLIGHPIANKAVDVLDPFGDLCPIGVPGELCVSGAGVARGYLGKPALTAARFVPNPVRPGQVMYRTGDLAVRRADGNLAFLGRVDDQVKIRGQRVEPGEVAAVLAAHPEVRRCAVVARPLPGTGELALVAYVVGRCDPPALRAFLEARLPAAMVPAAYAEIAELPLGPNGKLDRRALPDPGLATAGRDDATRFTAQERRVARVWEQALGQPVTDPDAGLFALGGHSLTAARIAAGLQDEFGTRVPLNIVFLHQTVRALAAYLAGAAPLAPESGSVAALDGPVLPLSRAQRRIWAAARSSRVPTALNISDAVRPGRALDPDTLRRAVAALADRHEVLRTRFAVVDGVARQIVMDRLPGGAALQVVHLGPGAGPEAVTAGVRAAQETVFDLATGPLFAVRLLRGAPDGDVLVVTAHHIVYDGDSVDLVVGDLLHAHDELAAGREPWQGRPPALQYREWTAREAAWLAGPEAAADRAYWHRTLGGPLPRLDLRSAAPRTAGPARAGALTVRTVPLDVVDTAARTVPGATPFMTLLAAWTRVLHRHGGGPEIIVGSPAAGRDRSELAGVVGCFVNALPLRLAPGAAGTTAELLAQVRDRVLEAYEHARFPYDITVTELVERPPRGRRPVYDAGLSWEFSQRTTDGWEFLQVPPAHLPLVDDLRIYATARDGELRLELVHDPALFTPDTAAELLDEVVDTLAAHDRWHIDTAETAGSVRP
ncbi:non-ribosomal peptide synthetase [Streptomyces sp. S.PB5]|uniref:non-ribosomal peptide synthetase n=1 Tax=Streptomyces sp. S.PB5 TaxID=3020844 RepID=UPI0025B095CF|nr:non-ribosomal peptide synthetase [Streptomyces sp. S.PB5]MDN3025974.1 amino acid adenylation domain-containing protein [Streptomyces sp. S.PB5]